MEQELKISKIIGTYGVNHKINGSTLLCIACHNGSERTVGLLLDKGADTNIPDNDGDVPLLIACSKGDLPIVSLLLGGGAKTNVTNHKTGSDFRPLHFACTKGYYKIAEQLLTFGAKPNLRAKGLTPLMLACMGTIDIGYIIVSCLLYHGADVNIVNKDGKTALDIATENGRESFANLITKKRGLLGKNIPSTRYLRNMDIQIQECS